MTYMLNVNGQDFEVEIKAHETPVSYTHLTLPTILLL